MFEAAEFVAVVQQLEFLPTPLVVCRSSAQANLTSHFFRDQKEVCWFEYFYELFLCAEG